MKSKSFHKSFVHLSVLFLLAVCTLSGQQSSFDLPDYNPVSPNAASLGKVGLYPVNKNLGTTSVNIPIYTLQEGDLSVPIGLNYNTSGIRLNDMASWVGLGWSLDAGGAIIRNVKGLPDKSYNSAILDLQNATFDQTNFSYMVGASKGLSDTAPDQYVMNVLGRSASFYFNPENGFQAEFEDGSPIKIIVVSADEMHAILEDGTLLIFGKGSDNALATEITRHNNPNYTFEYVSTWYLTELFSTDRAQNISFRYQTDGVGSGYCAPAGENIYIDGSFAPSSADVFLKAPYHELPWINKKYLEKIVFDNGHIEFERGSRTDLIDDFKLEAIKVYNVSDTPNEKLIDEYHFTYGYFNRSGGNYSLDYEISPISFTSTKQVNSRTKALKLLSMYRGASVSEGQVHNFEYNATTLPERCTTAQDFWGFANGNTGSLLPATTAAREGVGPPVPYFFGNGDRSVDETKMKAAVLEKITYPTGGYTILEYEANRFSVNDVIYTTQPHLVRAFGAECIDPSEPDSDEMIIDVPSTAINIKFHLMMGAVDAQGSSASYLSVGDQFYYRPTPKSTGGSSDSSDGLDIVIDVSLGDNIGTVSNPVIFNPGEWTIKAVDTGIGGATGARGCSTMQLVVSWDEPTDTQLTEKLVGGLRTTSISNYDGVAATPVQVKKFEYAQPQIIHPEENRGYIRQIYSTNQGIALNPRISTTPHFNNNLGGEPVIAYDKVTEYDYDPVTQQNKGKTVSFFEHVSLQRTMSSVLGSTSFTHPQFSWAYFFSLDNNAWTAQAQQLLLKAIDGAGTYSFYETNTWKRGKLSREEIYKTQNGNDVMIAMNEYEYSTLKSLKIKSNFVYSPFESPSDQWIVSDPYNPDTDLSSIQYSYQIGETELGRRVMSKKTSTSYNEDGLNPLVTVTDYSHDNLDHLQVTRSESTNSRGQTIETETIYPDDVANTGSLGLPELSGPQNTAIGRLKRGGDLHRVAEPVQTVTTVKNGNTVVSKSTQRTLYRDWGNDLVQPDSILTLKGDYSATNKMQHRISFHDYDDKGNVNRLSKANGPSIVYIWGYAGAYPIAKIENATHAQIAVALGTTEAAVKAFDETDLATIDGLRSSLPTAMVTTYTYDPLIGVTSITDPRGYTTHYTYDGFNRLKEVKDAESLLIEDYQYQYKTQD